MYEHVLLAVDLGHDESWKHALPAAVEQAKRFESTLHVMTVVPDFGMTIVGSFFPADFEKTALETAREKLHAFVTEHVPGDIPVQHIVGHGRPAAEVMRFADKVDADLIVIGSHTPGAEQMLLGSTAAEVVRHTVRSVLVVRG